MTRKASLGQAPLEYYDDTDRTCRWCKIELTNKRRTRFCRDECQEQYWIRRDSPRLGDYCKKRDKWTCQICFVQRKWDRMYMQADHIVPIADGGDEFDPDNIRTLCQPCHKAVTKQWHKGRRKPKEPAPQIEMLI